MSHADATALAEGLRRGERSVREVTEESLDRLRDDASGLGAVAELLAERALERADDLDARRSAGEPLGALFGLPLALKANLCLEGTGTHCGSRLLEGYRAPTTGTAVARALAADAVPVALCHMDEFGMGSSGESSAWAVARNPWDTRRTPGGSSSGCAAVVAAGAAPLALGTDTGGSVRQPASFCGLTGFKPTWGRVSRSGVVAYASSLDQVSPLATSARDCALVLGAIAGEDPLDATTLREEPPAVPLPSDLAGLRLGVAPELLPEAVEADVRARFAEGLDVLLAGGAVRREVALPRAPLALSTYYVAATAEASSNLARFDGLRFGVRAGTDAAVAPGADALAASLMRTRSAGFGTEVKRRILLGTYVLSAGYQDAWYRRALDVRRLLAADFARAFEEVDLIACPTSPTPAFRLGERDRDPLAMYAADLLTVPASLAGLPAVSVPCGTVERDGTALPVGLQLIGPRGADAPVLAAAIAFQERTTHHLARAAEAHR